MSWPEAIAIVGVAMAIAMIVMTWIGTRGNRGKGGTPS